MRVPLSHGGILSAGWIEMDPTKVETVWAWPIPESRKQLQRFPRFCQLLPLVHPGVQLYRCPVNHLTFVKQKFTWTQEADQAFSHLKNLCSSAPVLVLPDHKQQFIVKYDASSTGVGAVLSQRAIKDQKHHPCTFFPHKLASAERNYDVGHMTGNCWQLS